MPLDAIAVTVEATIEIPVNWLTAEEANKMATSLANEKIHTFITNVMGHIKRAALEGKTREIICCLSANNEVYERAVDFLKALGYSVSGSPSQGCSITIKW